MIWDIHMGVFYTFNEARRLGQHPGWMSGWEGGWVEIIRIKAVLSSNWTGLGLD